MKYYIRTFGCQMNEHDSEFIAGQLEKLGYTPACSPEEADIVVVNSCSVRKSAENKIFGFINSLKQLKAYNNQLVTVVCGCMVSTEEKAKAALYRRPYIDIILGTRSLHKLGFYLDKLREKPGPYIDIDLKASVPEGRCHIHPDSFRSYLTITYGCDNFCSYCIVPYVRGREHSRTPGEIIKEAKMLAESGVKEIMLLGQNVNSYGKGLDPKDKASFADLLYMLNNIEGLERIRYMTSHPKDFSDDIIDAIAGCSKVCNHFHLPFQAGSDRILKLMNRHYQRDYYLDLMGKINSRFPDAVLTTDIIIGFPGETEEDFDETLDILKKVIFDNAYTFLYSPREGTPAAKAENQIADETKKDRFNRLAAVQNEISLAKNKAMLGKEYVLMGEGRSKNNPLIQAGRTEGNKIVNFAAENNKDYSGELIKVKITEANTWSLKGELV